MVRNTISQHSSLRRLALLMAGVFVVALTITIGAWADSATASATNPKTFAQALVETTLAKHSELAGLGLSTTPPHGHACVSIADTDAKELGDKCDKGELAVMKTGKPTVKKENDGYDVTLPLRVSGKTIGIIAMDFKLDQQETGLLDRAKVIAQEIESQIPAKSKLFETSK